MSSERGRAGRHHRPVHFGTQIPVPTESWFVGRGDAMDAMVGRKTQIYDVESDQKGGRAFITAGHRGDRDLDRDLDRERTGQ